jgi:hypothetical protein
MSYCSLVITATTYACQHTHNNNNCHALVDKLSALSVGQMIVFWVFTLMQDVIPMFRRNVPLLSYRWQRFRWWLKWLGRGNVPIIHEGCKDFGQSQPWRGQILYWSKWNWEYQVRYLGNQMPHFKSRNNVTVVCDIACVKIPLWAVAVGRWKLEGKEWHVSSMWAPAWRWSQNIS